MKKASKRFIVILVFIVFIVMVNVGAKKLFLANKSSESAIVSLVFDDGWLSVSDNALPIMNHFGLKGTAYIVSSYMQGIEVMMSRRTIKDLKENGWAIGSHSMTHPFLTKKSLDEIDIELVTSKNDLEKVIGFPVHHFASPYGDCDSRVLNRIKKHYLTHRTNQPGINVRPWKKYDLKYMEVNIDTTIEQINMWMDMAVKSNGWLILGFHKVGVKPENKEDIWVCSTKLFVKILEILKNRGLEVKTLDQIIF